MSIIVKVKDDGNEVLYFRIVEESGKFYVERPDSPSLETQPGDDIYATIAIALVNMQRRDKHERLSRLP